MYFFLNSFIGYSQWCTGTSAERMVHALRKANLIDFTDPGVIQGHVGNQFNLNKEIQFKYIVVLEDRPDAIVKSEAGISYFKKTFSVVNNNQQNN
jgi:hypothetical protein